MPRQARVASETGYYHVMLRGNNREYIFNSKEQKSRFMGILREKAEEGLLRIAAWCLMDNHVHLVLNSELADLSRAMRSINVRYAMGFNTQEDRIGHVFQDRYRSEVIRHDRQLLSVIRYVHNNPKKAGIANDIISYPWSSYRAYMEGSLLIGAEQRALVLDHFRDIADFAAFHAQPDTEEHLDLKEDIETQRLIRGQEIIAAFCRTAGKARLSDLLQDSCALEELICELLKSSRLSHRGIASLLGVSSSRVHHVNVKD